MSLILSIALRFINSRVTWYVLIALAIFFAGMKYEAKRIEMAGLKEKIDVTDTYVKDSNTVRDRYKNLHPDLETALSGQVSTHARGVK